MQYTEIMVRYGELSTKGKNRKSFIDRLGFNTRESLHSFSKLVIKANRDRMHIQLNGEDSTAVMKRLKQVFGIQNFSPSVKVKRDVELVKQKAVEMIKEQFEEGATFKINTRRSDHDFELDTNEMNDLLGGYVLDNIPGIKVQMKKPDITLRVEIRSNGIFLSSKTINGAGGLPVGTAGKGMLMLSGGIDSPVAGYLAMKRGVAIEMVHFFSPPYTSEQALNKAKELTSKLAPFVGSIKFIQVPFTEIQETVKHDVPSGYLMTVQRRFMLRLATLIAKKREGLAIFNGEALGQVASQTLESMVAINDVTTLPVLRPVVSMDKNEIIEIAQEIDTFDLSIMPFEDCCTIFAPPAPKTRPRLDKARLYEARLDVDGLIERAMAGIKITEIKSDQKFLAETSDSFAELL
ncbi:tRNA uracil 4-sulfurtransferase ThiI [Liquorilactobacillus mali]|uniref:Probable tRNA sulfurtransferase n=1 Tax=Liquorilactobacillus mali KCTC 3596 = DSM 20444 TaxID=1046596 RepID=J0L8F3_9LACO|nr:tRNA uracil 4-sulfurtransferase ThiI [Liquorilactobacillus mali]EJF02173.1 thiamine biosynthesis protein thiI [Liquorilactobacillus mali KCTC 3596 = DSM 20444]KRN10221.1 thiamine biosynthesis protein [Liquorilactobacillus mali KCTC 3596 = DSM 20444]MDC7952776.1 tRNA 4-thiouridine(8) synthase ThiI [Liquorilactobacillus mali]MDV7757956.1 tRNA 4-thiouridine(8) synthase ThiI [Liquorilactobacillus mali]QFQ74492.1 tRNA 4-thiouridine(8) synthase ThiI [Liquorilactobacillus mali]